MYFLCGSMYCLFCVVLCIVCVYMCTELLPRGGYPIAFKYIILYPIFFFEKKRTEITDMQHEDLHLFLHVSQM
jgi:hypothetical protein